MEKAYKNLGYILILLIPLTFLAFFKTYFDQIAASFQNKKDIALFDGETLAGWEGSDSVFRVEGGAIIGGSLKKGLEESFYLCTTEEYSDFELTLSVKFIENSDVSSKGSICLQAHQGEPYEVHYKDISIRKID